MGGSGGRGEGAGVAAIPTFVPDGGSGTQSVTINTITQGAQIRYNIGESPDDPTSGSGTLLSRPIRPITVIPTGTGVVIKAIAFKSGMADSAVATSNPYTP